MKMIIALAALVAVAVAAPQVRTSLTSDRDAVVVRSDLDNIGVDGYRFAYETSNGIAADESAQVNNVGTDNESISARGRFSYVGPDGVTYSVEYIADENGFQPVAAHLPVSP